VPRFRAFIDDPETTQNFLLALATFAVTFAFAGTDILISTAIDFIVRFLPLSMDGEDFTTGGIVATVGAMQSERASEPAGLVKLLGHAVADVAATVAT
jgi:hypothetical protein